MPDLTSEEIREMAAAHWERYLATDGADVTYSHSASTGDERERLWQLMVGIIPTHED